jgi:glycosyltransferase involved in cell wall biosynthesis
VKILLSAYACEPERGSEPEVGLRAMLGAARMHEVWVLTRSNNLPALHHVVEAHALADRVHLEGIDLGPGGSRVKRWGPLGLHWYYDRWQDLAARRAMELERRVGFDVVHHVTFASYWTKAGVAAVGKPFLWGPVGGGVDPLLRLAPDLGLRGAVEDLGRLALRRVSGARPSVRSLPRIAALTLVQNAETGRRVRGTPRARTLPNATAVTLDRVERPARPEPVVAFVGRLTPWKGARLAVRALRYVRHPDVPLHIFGDGPDRQSVAKLAHRLDLGDRVVFLGRLPRREALASLGRCAVLLHPAMHDDSPLSMAEALSLGVPVVALDRGGPAELARWWPQSPSALVRPGSSVSTARRLADEVDRFLERLAEPPSEPLRPIQSFEEGILDAYQAIAGAEPRRSRRAV